ncbi:TetR/AcrR family transcriptional regulator, partial [Saccharothrix sp. ST-888]|uniref:TetR/AcrR family transcriptional regulator n=1 Tax=Saccharothrix sp. ST-888 TaxID=1427391 RepID=UPI0005EC717D
MDHEEARSRLLEAAKRLFYERGIQTVAIDELRATSGVSLKRLYQYVPSNTELVEQYLQPHDETWLPDLSEYIHLDAPPPEGRLAAGFDRLH